MRTPHASFAAAALALGLGACGARDTPPAPAPAPAAAASERLTLKRAALEDTKVVAATVETRDVAEARTRIGGTLVALSVRAGDPVRRGQVIGRVADQRLAFQTSAADAQAGAAAAEAARAQAELSRTRYLYDNGVYAKARLEQVESQAKAAEGALAAARAQRGASAALVGQGAILAPSDGRVLQAATPPGSVVGPGQVVATLTSGPPVLRLEVPEAEARALKVGQPVDVFGEDLPGAGGATLSQIYPAVDRGRVVADVTAPGLRPELIGQRVRVRLTIGRRAALAIPRRFVAHRYGLDYVRVVGRDGRASEVAVQLAPTPEPQMVEVLSGLAEGDVIVPPGA